MKKKPFETSIFSFSHNVFYPFQEGFLFFKLHLFCCLQKLSIWTSLKVCYMVKVKVMVFHSSKNKDLSFTVLNLSKTAPRSILYFSYAFIVKFHTHEMRLVWDRPLSLLFFAQFLALGPFVL